LQIFARDLFNQPRIGFQRANLIAQFQIFFVQAIQVLSDSIDLALRPPHSDITVRPEHVVHDQCQHK